ncbi:citrate/2-methylcitrate synthase [Amnibacterium sp. CER49]|uniref:citrate/2-methylcitrate synthase n=1 Tax=Amnibacterium sp. CER49 TaxID=3039161 RepID=UPI00244A5A55|nr:citrate/2-methylcitrate synthase [Amnibacterium sp. CER49]MDH2443511.1 citrate/2-methylcitrate synthase [Amnibacterium sp. CER49]
MVQISRMDDALIEVPRGLTNVAVVDTAISDVHGREGYYQYREHSATALARGATLEQVWFLFLHGRLPTADEEAAFVAELAALRAEVDVEALVEQLAGGSARLDAVHALKAAWPLVASGRGMRPVYDLDEQERRRDALLLTAMVPGFLATLSRRQRRLPPLASPKDHGTVAGYLTQVTGAEPTPEAEHALTAYLIAVMDHGLNASTFTARVITSTGADVASALTGALGSLSGPLHGGAPSRVLDSLDQIPSPEAIEPWISAELAAGRRLMGFGHAVYRTADPRSQLLRAEAQALGGPRVDLALRFEATAERLLEAAKPGRGLHANVEFYASIVMERVGIARELFTPTFALARAIGWSAHILEQAADSKIFRPAARYIGPPVSDD